MLMTGGKRLARVRYLHGTLRLISDGDHVVCAVTGTEIPIHQIKYWSVAKQEAYINAEASLEASKRA